MLQAESLEIDNPDFTPEIMAQVDKIVSEHRDKPGCLIPILEECQRVVGYVPVELQEYLSRALNIPGSTIFGVVTFYSFFTMVPKGRHTVKVCMGTACYVRGTKEIVQKIEKQYGLEVGQTTEDRRFSLEAVRCLGACGLAPVVVVDEDTHGAVKPDQIEEILERYD